MEKTPPVLDKGPIEAGVDSQSVHLDRFDPSFPTTRRKEVRRVEKTSVYARPLASRSSFRKQKTTKKHSRVVVGYSVQK